MQGTIAITDHGWYRLLSERGPLDEVNFWKPSATRAFVADEFSPFLFKLRKAEGNAICGFGFFVRYARMPHWLAWDWFGVANGCETLESMRQRIGSIRDRIDYRGSTPKEIGCILISHPVFFPRDLWVRPPTNWPPRTQTEKKYDLSEGEGARVWQDCLDAARQSPSGIAWSEEPIGDQMPDTESTLRLVTQRLGQGTFRVAVMEAYDRGCAVTGEHSLPALDAAHIVPFAKGGPHDISNGVLLRADLHRLFDTGYLTISMDYQLVVGQRLREHFANGHSYYPLDEHPIRVPSRRDWRPDRNCLKWHNEHVFQG